MHIEGAQAEARQGGEGGGEEHGWARPDIYHLAEENRGPQPLGLGAYPDSVELGRPEPSRGL